MEGYYNLDDYTHKYTTFIDVDTTDIFQNHEESDVNTQENTQENNEILIEKSI